MTFPRKLKELTDCFDEGQKLGRAGKRQDEALDGRNLRWEVEVGPLVVVCTNLEAVLEDAVDDSSDTEGGLND